MSNHLDGISAISAAALGAIVGLLLCVQAALAAPTPQQKCDYDRITAWKAYLSCVNRVVAKEAKGTSFNQSAAFGRCLHTYFRKWTAFQTKASLAGSSCVGSRFTDNGDNTLTDNLTGLQYGKKSRPSSPSIPFPPLLAVREASPPGRTATCGLPRARPTRSER